MPTYAIGDIQGCQQELLDLLDRINYDERNDRLLFVGDIVNRGPDSLEALRFVRHCSNAVMVLGNHDLHLLAVASADTDLRRKKDTLDDILEAEDHDDLIDWLRRRPLLHHDTETRFVLVHAGLPPQWDLGLARDNACEVEAELSGGNYRGFLDRIYGNQPDLWHDGLHGIERLRYSVNALTRMRFCDHKTGRLALEQKGPPGSQEQGLLPWFDIEWRKNRKQKILFGHWSTLRLVEDDYASKNVFPLDTGCIWGGRMTALRLEDLREFSVPSRQPRPAFKTARHPP